jgi:hypothetical protein
VEEGIGQRWKSDGDAWHGVLLSVRKVVQMECRASVHLLRDLCGSRICSRKIFCRSPVFQHTGEFCRAVYRTLTVDCVSCAPVLSTLEVGEE